MIHSVTNKFVLLGCLVIGTCGSMTLDSSFGQDRAEERSDESGEWIQLFNGADIDDWIPKIQGYESGENFGDTFRVEDGILKVSYDAYESFDGRFGHLFYPQSFSHYVLRAEYRFVGEQVDGGPGWAIRNSGLMLHGQHPSTMRVDQDFPVSIEVQLLGGNGRDERTTANLCTPGTNVVMNDELVLRHCNSSSSKTYHGEDWVVVEVEVHGDKVIRHLMDGKEVLSYEQPQWDERDPDAAALIKDGVKLISGGFISIQSESHPVEFRKIEIRELK